MAVADMRAARRTGKHGLARVAAAVACIAACAALTGCSSGPDAQAQGQTQRDAVLPAAKTLHSQLTATGVGWIGSITGSYLACGSNDTLATPSNGSSIQYTAQELMTPYRKSTAYSTFQRQVVEALKAIGWSLTPSAGGSSEATYYTGHRDNTDLRLIELDQNPGLGPTATIFLSSACYDAGSSAQQLIGKGAVDNIHEPIPTTTPVPKFS